MDSTKAMEAVARFHDFYSSAWSSLLNFSYALAGLFLVLVPLLGYLIQRNILANEKARLNSELRDHKASISKEMEDRLATVENSLHETLSTEIANKHDQAQRGLEAKLNESFDSLQKRNYGTLGRLYHHEGLRSVQNGWFADATSEYAYAAYAYLLADEQQNLERVMINLDGVVKHIDSSDFSDHDVLRDHVDMLETAIDNSSYGDLFKTKLTELKKARTRERPPSPSTDAD